MDRDYEKAIIEDDLDRLVRQAFGVDEDQLMHDFLLAQTEIREDQIPPEPEDGFDQLIKKNGRKGDSTEIRQCEAGRSAPGSVPGCFAGREHVW